MLGPCRPFIRKNHKKATFVFYTEYYYEDLLWNKLCYAFSFDVFYGTIPPYPMVASNHLRGKEGTFSFFLFPTPLFFATKTTQNTKKGERKAANRC